MRIKFNKGFMPGDVARLFLQILEKENTVIGTVNIYVQEYDDDMKAVKGDTTFLEVTPGDESKSRYSDYSAEVRRSKMKAIV